MMLQRIHMRPTKTTMPSDYEGRGVTDKLGVNLANTRITD